MTTHAVHAIVRRSDGRFWCHCNWIGDLWHGIRHAVGNQFTVE